MTTGAIIFAVLIISISEVFVYRRAYKKGYEYGKLEERIKNMRSQNEDKILTIGDNIQKELTINKKTKTL